MIVGGIDSLLAEVMEVLIQGLQQEMSAVDDT